MLTPAQLDARRGKLTASRVACLMEGNREKILRLYRELTGEEAEEDLSDVWAVQLGSATEALNLEWYERKTHAPLSFKGDVIVSFQDMRFACTLDGFDDTLNCPVECKHVGGREPLEVVIDRYQPQMQWQMYITETDQCVLSVIMGANEPIIEFIPRDDGYITEMVNRAKQFMHCVEMRREPVELDPVAPPIDASKVYDMTESNSWAEAAYVWLGNRASKDRCVDAEKILKSMVPADAKKCSGHAVQITRDRAGRLSLREATPT
jgi:predicted phage-related endonuclease